MYRFAESCGITTPFGRVYGPPRPAWLARPAATIPTLGSPRRQPAPWNCDSGGGTSDRPLMIVLIAPHSPDSTDDASQWHTRPRGMNVNPFPRVSQPDQYTTRTSSLISSAAIARIRATSAGEAVTTGPAHRGRPRQAGTRGPRRRRPRHRPA